MTQAAMAHRPAPRPTTPTPRPDHPVGSLTNCIVRSRQHTRLCGAGKSGGADLVTVTSQPHSSSGQRYICPSRNAIITPSAGLHSYRRKVEP
jgi:hypothetical protein